MAFNKLFQKDYKQNKDNMKKRMATYYFIKTMINHKARAGDL